MNQKDTINLTIDNKPYKVAKGLSILQAAEQNNIYIPTLCAHKELTPYGGCRMCIVEVEGMRNLPTACTTPAADGMIIRTDTAQIKAMRTEILQLFLSEHTSSCLICDEKDECRQYMGTIRKAGVTTGCRYCPNDEQCELQDVVAKLGASSLNYPIYYRNLRVEREDPFYERNYNLCILCGRCVRVCQEVRVADVLAFNHRGRSTVIGPAHERTHLEAGCEFCGACVSVCPTGSLTEKARAWEGKPDREEITTCTFCGVGCQMRILVRDKRVIGSLPADDTLVNNSQLCVKGRFSVTELVNGHKRLRRPFRNYQGTEAEITWTDAVTIAAEKLADCAPGEFGMLVSPNCTNEDLYIAQKFTRVVMGSNNVDTSARSFYGAGFNAYVNLMRKAVTLSDIRKASAVLCVGLDTRFGRSVVGVELRRAHRRGAKIVTMNPREHNLTLISDEWIRPVPGTEVDILKRLVRSMEKKGTAARSDSGGVQIEQIQAIADMFKQSENPIILVGSEFLQYDNSGQILEAIEALADSIGAGILPLPAQNNLYGSILMGAYPEVLPGGEAFDDERKIGQLNKKWGTSLAGLATDWNSAMIASAKKIKVLYLVGEVPPGAEKLQADFIISQNIYSSEPVFTADLTFPSAAFTESDGSFINGEGRVQRVRKAVNPPDDARPDWKILCEIAQKMGKKGFSFATAADVHKEISGLVKGFADFDNPERKARPLAGEIKMNTVKLKKAGAGKADETLPFILTTSMTEHTHRGFPLSTWVEGTRALFSDERLDINPEDARKAKISDGDEVAVISETFKRSWPARIKTEQASGRLHVTLHYAEAINPNPHPVRIRRKNV